MDSDDAPEKPQYPPWAPPQPDYPPTSQLPIIEVHPVDDKEITAEYLDDSVESDEEESSEDYIEPRRHNWLRHLFRRRRPVVRFLDTTGQLYLTAESRANELVKVDPLKRFSKRVLVSRDRPLQVARSSLVDPRLVRRLRTEFGEGETHIDYALRLYWMPRIPKQALIASVWLVALVLQIWIAVNASDWVALVVTDSVMLAWTIAAGALFVRTWGPWYFTYLVVTDRRIMLIYNPPLLFKDGLKESLRSAASNATSESSGLGRILDYGDIKVDTPSQHDQWLNEELTGVAQPARFVALLTATK